MSKFSTQKTTPRKFTGGQLPDGEYTVELKSKGSWDDKSQKFADGKVGTSSNGNAQFVADWQITEGPSHVKLFVHNRWTVTEGTFASLLGDLEIINGEIPTIESDSPRVVSKTFIDALEIGTKMVAFCGTDEGRPVVKWFVRKA